MVSVTSSACTDSPRRARVVGVRCARCDDVEPRCSRCPTASTSSTTADALGDRRRAARRYVGYSMGGRLCLQLALDRPDVVRAARARERVARHRRRRRARGAARRRRAARAGDRARRRRRVPRTLARATAVRVAAARARAASTSARRRTPSPLTHQLRVLGQGAQPSNWDRLGELAMPVLLDRRAGSTRSTSTSRAGWPSAIPRRARRGHRRRRARVPPRATRRASLTCSPPGSIRVARQQLGIGRDRAHRAATPSTGTSGSRVDVARRAATSVASPHAYGSSGSAAASASPAAMPDRRLHHRRHDRGDARASATVERGAHTAERLLLQHDHVGGVERAQPARVVERADALVGRDRHVDAPPHPREVVERRDRLLDELEVVAREHRRSCATAVSTSHAPLASTRTRDAGPTASRTARDEVDVARRPAPSPSPRGTPRSVLGVEAGPSTSAFTGTESRTRGREAEQRRLLGRAPARRGIATGSPASGEHSPHPAGPSSSVTARSPMRSRCSRQDRHSPTLTSTATTTSSFDVADQRRDERRRIVRGAARAHRLRPRAAARAGRAAPTAA